MSYSRWPRGAGLLLHPTSLPGAHGIGDLGLSARGFVDWLSGAGLSLWQMLPLVPPGAGNSPYSTASALSGNPWLLDLRGLWEEGLLDSADLEAPSFSADRVDYMAVCDFKGPRLDKAAGRLLEGRGAAEGLREAFEVFCDGEPWVQEAATFMVLRRIQLQRPWWKWPKPLRDRTPVALAEARKDFAEEIHREMALQFLFERQWRALRDYCGERGVRILGDLPIYVDRDSVDVWAHREQFQLDPSGRPTCQAGVPPDYFSDTGQLWGNPIYHWDRMALDGYQWWIRRVRRALAQADLLRLDHFRGFSAYWSVPAGAADARDGAWVKGPGRSLFDAIAAALGTGQGRASEPSLGELPLLAEDLGDIDAEVLALRDSLGLPGMKVLQFAFGGGSDHAFLPHNYDPHCVVYTGTHDNDTTLGWWLTAQEGWRDHVRRYLARDGHDVVWDLIRLAMASVADMAVMPMQDVLSLDSGARMNRPSVAEGNWAWRVREEAFHPNLAARLRELVELYHRALGDQEAQAPRSGPATEGGSG